jgi:hypothetical protein
LTLVTVRIRALTSPASSVEVRNARIFTSIPIRSRIIVLNMLTTIQSSDMFRTRGALSNPYTRVHWGTQTRKIFADISGFLTIWWAPYRLSCFITMAHRLDRSVPHGYLYFQVCLCTVAEKGHQTWWTQFHWPTAAPARSYLVSTTSLFSPCGTKDQTSIQFWQWSFIVIYHTDNRDIDEWTVLQDFKYSCE